ncbi:MAG: TadE/TadG family type IV pilus assembly protein [Candidatus Binatia bacterium]
MRWILSFLRNRRGQTIVEFALMLPFLLVIVGGIIDWGLAFFVGQVIENASREGARAGAVIPPSGTPPVNPPADAGPATFPGCESDSSPMIAAACSRLPNVGLFNGFSVQAVFDDNGGPPNQLVRVTVSGTYNWFLLQIIGSGLPLTGSTSLGSGVDITRSTAMRWEWQPPS